MVGEPAVGDGGESWAWDARQGVQEETVDDDSEEKSSAEDQGAEREPCDQAGGVRDPTEDVNNLRWHSHWH